MPLSKDELAVIPELVLAVPGGARAALGWHGLFQGRGWGGSAWTELLDRIASIRIPGSKKERPPLPHMKQSHSADWSSTPMDAEDFAPKPLSEREIIALFEKMMEDMNLNEDKKMPLREKDFHTKKEMVMQYISTASKS
ncbi:PREDICTED: protein diaphanous homolog 3-like, partial [Eurypyga helias]|uniref:protein diaphanous homolog 3-like n=1 Tax=Eurypyga helias TaxID=54383 RepID=UPI0005282797